VADGVVVAVAPRAVEDHLVLHAMEATGARSICRATGLVRS
jgi:hypothetical protein